MRAPRVPDGATFGQSQSYQNISMRWLRDYDAAYLRDRSVLSVFSGTAAVIDGPTAGTPAVATFVRAVKLTMA
jgi:hypothetical protein